MVMLTPETIEVDNFEYCPLCSGPVGVLGQLGHIEHLTCRHCGMFFTRDIDEWMEN